MTSSPCQTPIGISRRDSSDQAEWSDEDGEFVALAAEFPSLSFLAPTPYEALAGIKALVAEVLREMAQTRETPPGPSE
ncbi:hypothetical protein [Mycobacterium sp. 155]|uniref:hypothetical protein n=1 Tax=Mycobacterium sp. 155 TaxID=1157943 RepID=UPI00036508CA|nr:hypothetical protein [Mycobacterium sp. 155]